MTSTNKVPVKIKLFDPELPVPEYKTADAAGFDLYARENMTVEAGKVVMVPLNIALEIPTNYWLLIAARSSLYKKGLHLINGVGVGDPDYCGDTDEYRLLVHNFSSEDVKITRGERLAQGILMPRLQADFELVKSLAHNQNRGGIGSTGS